MRIVWMSERVLRGSKDGSRREKRFLQFHRYGEKTAPGPMDIGERNCVAQRA